MGLIKPSYVGCYKISRFDFNFQEQKHQFRDCQLLDLLFKINPPRTEMNLPRREGKQSVDPAERTPFNMEAKLFLTVVIRAFYAMVKGADRNTTRYDCSVPPAEAPSSTAYSIHPALLFSRAD